jgi:hypothetical protein
MSLFGETLNEAKGIKLPFLVKMFHSSELMPGCSIFRLGKYAIEQLYNLSERFLLLIQKENIKSVTLPEAAKNCNL